ncbi:cell division protein FtsK [Photobacterium aphoticum]|uniref:Cell division protein FtsK n=1 Tax=Photobacterium aphoticum TaxID=754436 RepID=A0A090QRH9_9GAMM|nr:cell division protein FtsK [Photobacterium aphoticum]
MMAALAPETVAQSDISAAQQPQTSAPETDASHSMAPESESMVVETVPRQAQGMTIEELERALDLDEDFTVDAMANPAQADETFSPASQPVSQPVYQPAPQSASHMAPQSEAVSASTAPAMTPAEQAFTPAASTPSWEEDETPWDDEPAEHYSSSVHTASATTETVVMQPEMANPEIPNSGLQGSVTSRFDALDDEDMFDGNAGDDYAHNTPVAPAQTAPVHAPYTAPASTPQAEPHAMEIGVHDGMSELDRAQQGVPSTDDDGLSDEEAFLKKIRDAQKAQAHAAGLDNPFLDAS